MLFSLYYNAYGIFVPINPTRYDISKKKPARRKRRKQEGLAAEAMTVKNKIVHTTVSSTVQ